MHHVLSKYNCKKDSQKKTCPLQVDTVIFNEFGHVCSKYVHKFAISLWHLKKEVSNEVRILNALARSNTTLTIYYYTFNVFPPLTFFLSQYGI